jgi:hypothetical protein
MLRIACRRRNCGLGSVRVFCLQPTFIFLRDFNPAEIPQHGSEGIERSGQIGGEGIGAGIGQSAIQADGFAGGRVFIGPEQEIRVLLASARRFG